MEQDPLGAAVEIIATVLRRIIRILPGTVRIRLPCPRVIQIKHGRGIGYNSRPYGGIRIAIVECRYENPEKLCLVVRTAHVRDNFERCEVIIARRRSGG